MSIVLFFLISGSRDLYISLDGGTLYRIVKLVFSLSYLAWCHCLRLWLRITKEKNLFIFRDTLCFCIRVSSSSSGRPASKRYFKYLLEPLRFFILSVKIPAIVGIVPGLLFVWRRWQQKTKRSMGTDTINPLALVPLSRTAAALGESPLWRVTKQNHNRKIY